MQRLRRENGKFRAILIKYDLTQYLVGYIFIRPRVADANEASSLYGLANV